MELGLRMHAERTPNPNSIKWVLGRPVVEGGASAHFDAPPSEEVSPLAARAFAIAGVTVVFVASNFVTVDALKEVLAGGGPALGPGFEPGEAVAESAVVERIRRVLDEEVRPAVAMDGGDVVFSGFRDGVVEVYLQGSCSGCPSSTATLKHGIEARLREAVPEVQGVVAL